MRLRWLERFAERHADALSRDARPLSKREIAIAREVFGDALDMTVVSVVHSKIAATPTTLGNVIRTSRPFAARVLVHELVHVWQYQYFGTGYISDSLVAQCRSLLTTGSRRAAYEVDVVPGKAFASYSSEQQAVIVERWFAERRGDAAYGALVEELRGA